MLLNICPCNVAFHGAAIAVREVNARLCPLLWSHFTSWCHKLPRKLGDIPAIEQCERADSATIGGDQVLDSNERQQYTVRCPENKGPLGPRISAPAAGTAREAGL